MREIILDTETTGLDPAEGHRIFEVAAMELISLNRTGKIFHKLLNPERALSDASRSITGRNDADLKDKPVFAEVADEFLGFIADAKLVIHNAEFDLKFLNAELQRLGLPALRNPVEDTVKLARRKFPGSPANLDALCRRFNIDLSRRAVHGAHIDVELLAEVYVELCGGKQQSLIIETTGAAAITADTAESCMTRLFIPPRPHNPTTEEEEAHNELLKNLPNNLWG